LETVIMLGAGLLLSLSLGMIAALALPRTLPQLPETAARFYSSVLSNLSFQGAVLVLTHFFLRWNETTWRHFLGLDHPQLKRAIFRAFAVAALVLPMALMVRWVSDAILVQLHAPAGMQPALQIIQLSVSSGKLVYAGVIAILIAPVAEEILFRGILYATLKQHGWGRVGLVGSSLLFGLIHGHAGSFMALSFLGFIFALLYDRTSTLVTPILAHSLFNLVNFCMFLSSQKAGG
jgi:membrane protease YdiL (CAAX protease family)